MTTTRDTTSSHDDRAASLNRRGFLAATAGVALIAGSDSLAFAADGSPSGVYRVLVIAPGAPAFERFTNLMNAIATQMPGVTFTLAYTTESDAVQQLVSDRADMIVPYPAKSLSGKPYFLSAAPVTKAYYLLYTNTSKPLDIQHLSQYVIEGDLRNAELLGLSIRESGGVRESLIKVHDGSIDAYINAEGPTDPVLRELEFKNIHRQLYKETTNGVLLPDTDRGHRFDRLLSSAVQRAVGSAGYDNMQKRPYGDWQP